MVEQDGETLSTCTSASASGDSEVSSSETEDDASLGEEDELPQISSSM